MKKEAEDEILKYWSGENNKTIKKLAAPRQTANDRTTWVMNNLIDSTKLKNVLKFFPRY